MDNLDDCDEAQRRVEIRGVPYSLMAFRTFGGFHSVWECGECDDTGNCGICETVEKAFQTAETEARIHYDRAHSS